MRTRLDKVVDPGQEETVSPLPLITGHSSRD